MSRIPQVVLIFCILADLALLHVLAVSPTFAYVGHLVITCIFFALLIFTNTLKGRAGITTFITLTFLLCLLAPFVGFLLIGAVLRKLKHEEPVEDGKQKYVVGNPMREASYASAPSTSGVSVPLIHSLGRERFNEIVEKIAYLKSDYSARSTELLKRIRDRSNAMAGLYANAAISARSTHVEQVKANAKANFQSDSKDLQTTTDLAAAHKLEAFSGSVADEEKHQALLSAIEYFAKFPEDEASVTGIVECCIELGDTKKANEWLAFFSNQTETSPDIEVLRRKVLAAEGNWRALHKSYTKTGTNDRKFSAFWVEPTR